MAVEMRACRFARDQELPLTFLLPFSHFAGILRTAPEDISFGLPLGLERQASHLSCSHLCTQIVPSQLEQGWWQQEAQQSLLLCLSPPLVPSSPPGKFSVFISKHWVIGKVNSTSTPVQTCGHTVKPGGSSAVGVPWAQQVLCARSPCPGADPCLSVVQPALPRSEERCPGHDLCPVSADRASVLDGLFLCFYGLGPMWAWAELGPVGQRGQCALEC